MASSFDRTWSALRFTTGMAILSMVFVVSHGLLLVHELAHLEHSAHDSLFHELEERYPLTERARGYLMALDHQGERSPD